jgi:hypothetical protein
LKPMLHHACDMTVQIAVSNNVFRTMLPNLAASDPKAYASSLAAAMPWGDYSVGRSDVARRRELYSPLWAAYLNDPQIPVTALSHIAANHLDKQHQPDLAFLEKKFATVRPFTFAGLVELNGDTHAACNSFTRGAAILRSAIDSGAPNQRTIDKAFETMNDIWTQSHHVRAVGAYLLETASAKGVLGAIGRTLSVKSGDDVVVFTA